MPSFLKKSLLSVSDRSQRILLILIFVLQKYFFPPHITVIFENPLVFCTGEPMGISET